MFERFTQDARTVVVRAQEESRQLGHPFIGCEHLLLAVSAADDATGGVLRDAGVTPDRVRAEIRRMIGTRQTAPASVFDMIDGEALAAIGIDLAVVRGKVEEVFGPDALRRTRPVARRRWKPPHLGRRRRRCNNGHIPFTNRAKKCLASSLAEAKALHNGYLGVEHLALAVVATKSSAAEHILATIGVSPSTLRLGILNREQPAT
ncbi:MAG TPA: Clp protease N-terminal domain-containing protein [Pseudonocardiaceae bacterium]|jgi:ATP-dependent Clp protease ATP-binding subunit ClpA|nr:Clp protease N-terminal domain-containing protein [Pseudonocardiaceae bacterium]